MTAIGFNRRGEQIQCKIKKWKAQYMNVVRQRAQGKRVTCRYFKDLAEIFADSMDNKLGGAALAEDGNDIVEIDLSQGGAIQDNFFATSSPRGIIVNWTGPETELLLQLWAQEDTQQKLNSMVHNKVIYEQISQQMCEAGYNKSAAQCIAKIKSIKKRYSLVEKVQRTGGVIPKNFVGYEIMKHLREARHDEESDESQPMHTQTSPSQSPSSENIQSSTHNMQQRLQHSNRINRTAKKIVQRSLALQQRLSQRSNDADMMTSDVHNVIYPSPEKADLVHITLEDPTNQTDCETSFMLENGLLKLQLLKDEFNVTMVKLQIGNHWVHLTEDDSGYIPLMFSHDSNFTIRGTRTHMVAVMETTQNGPTLNHVNTTNTPGSVLS